MRNLRVQICAGLLLVAIINPAVGQVQPGPQAPASETALVCCPPGNILGRSVEDCAIERLRRLRASSLSWWRRGFFWCR